MIKRLGLIVGTVGLVIGISGCGSDSSATTQKKVITRNTIENSTFKPTDLENTIETLIDAIDETNAQEMQLNVILKSLSDYWQPVTAGANRAIGELAVTGGVAAPNEDTGQIAIDDQNAMIKEAREQGSKGFGVAPFEKPVAEQIDASVDAGIPVVTVDSDLVDSKRDFYIGTMNSDAGKTAAGTLKGLLKGAPGTVVVLGHDDPGWEDGYQRSMGAKTVLEEAGYTVVVRRTDWTTTGEQADMDALATIFSTADPPVVGMLGMFSNAYRCAMAAEAAGRTANDIAIAAFDFDPKTVAYMQSGMIKATHAQRQFYMGYLTPYILYGVNVLGKAKVKSILSPHMVDAYRVNSGLDVVQASQLDAYYSFLDSLGAGG
jgi:ribose transport system substrate-binding protein